jgi:hypothetical protein
MTRQELEALGVDFSALTYEHGEMNIIVQQFATIREEQMEEQADEYDDPEDFCFSAYPDIYQPRKNRVWSCGCSGDPVSLETPEDRVDYAKHLRDSAERLKIMSIILKQQAKELEETGEIHTSLYYPEADYQYGN